MAFSTKVKEDVLVACGRHCCICHKFCGGKIEIHHIHTRGDGGDDEFDNAIALCFDCHADMTSYDHKHPKGTKYTESELKRHRNDWYKKVTANIGIVSKGETIESDKKVYTRLIEILPWNGTILFVRENNFAGFSFERKRTDDFGKFIDQCSNPEFEFMDPDLEGLRLSLGQYIDSFMSKIARETFPTHTPGWNSVPEEWESEQPDRFEEVVTSLHQNAQKICEIYDVLVKTAKRKLGVLPS
jgi:hypothetical protein